MTGNHSLQVDIPNMKIAYREQPNMAGSTWSNSDNVPRPHEEGVKHAGNIMTPTINMATHPIKARP